MNQNNKISYIGVILMLSLMLTVLGVLYVAYVTINKQLESVKEESLGEIKTLQDSMTQLQQTLSGGGNPELFIKLEDKVVLLESRLNDIQQQLAAQAVANITSVVPSAQAATANTEPTNENGLELPISLQEQVTAQTQVNQVTEAILDVKLAALEQKIDQKLETILNHLLQTTPKTTAQSGLVTGALLASKPTEQSVTQPNVPSVNDVKAPTVQAPVVSAVKVTEAPAVPAKPVDAQKPLKNYTADVQWLMNEPPLNYTMQLASTNEQALLNRLSKQKQ
jgi:septal ring-binding cell division protein DamX